MVSYRRVPLFMSCATALRAVIIIAIVAGQPLPDGWRRSACNVWPLQENNLTQRREDAKERKRERERKAEYSKVVLFVFARLGTNMKTLGDLARYFSVPRRFISSARTTEQKSTVRCNVSYNYSDWGSLKPRAHSGKSGESAGSAFCVAGCCSLLNAGASVCSGAGLGFFVEAVDEAVCTG